MGLFRRRPDPLAWSSYRSAEEYAYALMLQGVDTDEARRLLRDGIDASERLRNEMAPQIEAARRRRDFQERHREGAGMAARKLLQQVGVYPNDEDWA